MAAGMLSKKWSTHVLGIFLHFVAILCKLSQAQNNQLLSILENLNKFLFRLKASVFFSL